MCLDSNYQNLLLIKKIVKAVDEIASNQEYKQRAQRLLANPPPGVLPATGDEGRNKNYPQAEGAGGVDRLNTIEEEKAYDTQSNLYQTAESKRKGASSGKKIESKEEVQEEAYEEDEFENEDGQKVPDQEEEAPSEVSEDYQF